MRRITKVQWIALNACVVYLGIMICPLLVQWMWSGLHPGADDLSRLVPEQAVRDMDDTWRMRANQFFFWIAPGYVALVCVLAWISRTPLEHRASPHREDERSNQNP